MKIQIVGGGGREHAIAWKLAQSPRVDSIIAAPGNAGMSVIAECIDIGADDIDGQVALAINSNVDLVVVGPEVPLALGITDKLIEAGIKVFGPNKKCSQLEASKSFTKAFLARHDIPTAKYKEFTDIEELKKNVGIYGYPMVLKADGLASGKGVIIAAEESEAYAAIDELMGSRVFGSAGDKVVVEENLVGVEASVLCFVDGSGIIPMESAQDYKRIFDNDRGPNTGGMGTYSPSLLFDETLKKRINDEILSPTFAGFKSDGLDFRGVLFIGIMVDSDGSPRVIEFNNRFGDPETQSVLPRLESDLLEIFLACTEDRLIDMDIVWNDLCTVSVVEAAGGYPENYKKGNIINGLGDVDAAIMVFHAGTAFDDERNVITAGGRVLCVTAMEKTHEEARAKAYENIGYITFTGEQHRNDIGVVYKK